jgi:hypothetical protein
MYGDIGLRQFSDMDVLVHPEDAKRTLLLLESLGYRSHQRVDEQIEKCNEDLVHFSPMVLNDISVEVHIKLLNNVRDRHNIQLDKLWEKSEITLLSNQSIRALDLPDLLIHISLHLNKHMLSGTMQFTGWFDIVNLLEKYKSESDWNKLQERCDLFCCKDVVYTQIILAAEYMQANVPVTIYNENKHLVTYAFRKLFIKYLNGYKGFYFQDQSHIKTLTRINPFHRKINYLIDVVFPPELYMIYKYKIRNKKWYFLFYPYRWWIGITLVINSIIDKCKVHKNKEAFVVPTINANKYQLSPVDQLAFACMKLQPSEKDFTLMNSLISRVTDWDELGSVLSDRGLAPLFYRKINLLEQSNLIPEALKNKLEKVYYLTLVRNTLMYRAYKEFAETLHKKGLTFMPLKGIYLTESLYNDIGLRQFSDIDILVKPEDSQQIQLLFHKLGYKNNGDYFLSPSIREEVVHYNPMSKDGVFIEIHEKLHSVYKEYCIDPTIFFQRAEKGLLSGELTWLPAKYDHLIYICTHLDGHFQQGAIQFTGYCDIVNILNNREDWDWQKFIEQCEEYRCSNVVFKHIMLANKYMYLSLPDRIVNQFSGLLLSSDEKLLIRYLHGYRGFVTGLPKHLGNLKIQTNFQEKLIYLVHALFPPVTFMKSKFGQDNKTLIYFYYPYRYLLGLKGLIKLVFKSIRSK